MNISNRNIDKIIDKYLCEEIKKVIQENISHSNCYGVPRGLFEYRRSEREGILIVENRSVAAYIYRNEIKQVNNRINELINSGNYKNQYMVFNSFEFTNGSLKFDLLKNI